MKYKLLTTALAATAVALGAPSAAHDHKTITDLAVANENLTTLETAVIAAGLDGLLASEGPFTVLAPTDAAFGDLDPAVLDAALADPNGLLTTVLALHVIEGDYKSGELIALANRNGSSVEVPTYGGGMITLSVSKGKLTITDANGRTSNVVKQNVNASNGTIHVIDAVILPAL